MVEAHREVLAEGLRVVGDEDRAVAAVEDEDKVSEITIFPTN